MPRALRRSSVARSRASRASSSEVWEETAFFLAVLAVERGEGNRGNTSLRQQRRGLQPNCRF